MLNKVHFNCDFVILTGFKVAVVAYDYTNALCCVKPTLTFCICRELIFCTFLWCVS